MGEEADYAGTSFLAPPREVLGKPQLGSELVNVKGDRPQPGSLSAIGWDDEGVKPDEFMVIDRGVFVDYQTTREQAPWLDWWYRSRGQPVSLMPGNNDHTSEDLIAATDRGIAIIGAASYSIDQQR